MVSHSSPTPKIPYVSGLYIPMEKLLSSSSPVILEEALTRELTFQPYEARLRHKGPSFEVHHTLVLSCIRKLQG